MGVAKVIELIGESTQGWRCGQGCGGRASDTVGITGVEVLNLTANVSDGDVVEIQSQCKAGFRCTPVVGLQGK